MRYFFIVIIIFTTCSGFGQENKFRLGLNFAPSFITVRGAQYYDYDQESFRDKEKSGLWGIKTGLNIEYEFREKLSFVFELNYASKGGGFNYVKFVESRRVGQNKTYPSYTEKVTTDYRINYLTVPIYGSFKFGYNESFFINGGFFNGFLFGIERNSYGISSETKKYDAGLLIGVGISTDLSKRASFTFELRENLGLLNIDNTSEPGSEVLKTNSVNINFGLSWKLGKMDSK